MEEALLGGLSPQAFLRRHWQKRPLLVRARAARIPRRDRKSVRSSRSPRALTSNPVWWNGAGQQWQVTHGPLSRSRGCARAGRAQLDAAGERREPSQRACGTTAAPLRVHSAGAPGRRDGELRRAGRRRRPACRFLRRVPACRARAVASGASPARATFALVPDAPLSLIDGFPRRGGIRAGARRPALPAAGLGPRRRRARCLLHLLGRLPRAARRRARGRRSSTTCTSAACPTPATATRACAPAARPARIGAELVAYAEAQLGAHPLDARPTWQDFSAAT